GHQHHWREGGQGDGSLAILSGHIQYLHLEIQCGIDKVVVHHIHSSVTVFNIAHKVQSNKIAVLIDTVDLEGDVHSVFLIHLLQQSSTGRHIKDRQRRIVVHAGIVRVLQDRQSVV